VLGRKDVEYGRLFLRVGVIAGFVATLWQIYPSGDAQGQNVARHQPPSFAGMQALFKTEQPAPIHLIGQPNTAEQRLDNPITIPAVLSFLTYRRWGAAVKGLDAFPRDEWPDNIPLLYYSYHIMVGLGTIFIAIMVVAAFLLWRRVLDRSAWMLWILMLSFPFPFIANTAGWFTAELGRQPWLVYGLMRTVDGASTHVSAGNALFTLLGFMGMYTVLSMLYVLLMWREIDHGPRHGT
jgi:cytochrome d ubiquinol oxidase subunit I